MRRRILLLAGAAVAATVVVVLALGGTGRTPETLADPGAYSFDAVLCDGTGGHNDAKCTKVGTSGGDGDGIIEAGEHPEMITIVYLDPPPSVGGQAFMDMATTIWYGLVPAPGTDFVDGDIVGEIDFGMQSNLQAPAASNVNVVTGQPPLCGTNPMGDIYPIYDADMRTLTDLDKSGGQGAGLIATTDLNGNGFGDTQEDLVDEFGYAAGEGPGGSGGPNGLYDGVDLMPASTWLDVIPAVEASETIGAFVSRGFGVANVENVAGTEVNVDINVLVYELVGGGYWTVTTVGYPAVGGQEPGVPVSNILGQTVITCAPFDMTSRSYGVSLGNHSACTRVGCAGSPDPDITGGVVGRTAEEGKYALYYNVSSTENHDGDLASAPYDSCPAAVSIDSDISPYPRGETAPGDLGDRWDSGCDVDPVSSDNSGDTQVSNTAPLTGSVPNDPHNCNQAYIAGVDGIPGNADDVRWDCDQDVDGDTTLNTVDNCPTTPDADVDSDTVIDWQLDTDADTVGDVCDPAPKIRGDGSGYYVDAHPHDLLGGDPVGGAGYFHDHDARCEDSFAVPGIEPDGDGHECIVLVDTNANTIADWEDLNSSSAYEVGDVIDSAGDADGDGHTDGCEAVKGTDPLDPDSTPGPPATPGGPTPTGTPAPPTGDCDGDGTSDYDEVSLKSDFAQPGVATVTPTSTPEPKPAAVAECTHRIQAGDPTQVDIVCHLTDDAPTGTIYDWEVIYNDQVPVWPDPPVEPVLCTIIDPGPPVSSGPSTWTGLVIDADGDSIVETAKCKDLAGTDPWVEDTCRDMHVKVAGNTAIGSTLEIHLTDFDQNNIGTMTSTESLDWPAACGEQPTPTATPACTDREGDTQCDEPSTDPDDDGCTTAEETALGDNFDGDAWYDVYDVPVPAKADASGANGSRNKVIDIGDVLAVLFYAFADDNGGPNANGVDYDSIKGWDGDGDSVNDADPIHDIEEGQKYDRSPGLGPSGDTGKDPAGAPNGSIDIGDVLAVLAQAFAVDCSG